MSEVQFSIVIPTFNRAGFIGTTIRSVLDQSFNDFEVIVVDDGSTDNTEEVVAAIADDRVKYHRKENEERAAARNAGTALANGRYVTFLDSDDIVYPDHLQTAAEMIAQYNEPEWFHCGYEFVDENRRSIRTVNNRPSVGNDMLIDGNFLSCRGVFVRCDIAGAHSFNAIRELSGTEDYELWLRLASRYPLYCDNRITSAIVQHSDRSVINTSRSKLESRIRLLEEALSGDPHFMSRFGERWSEFQANNRVYIALHLALAKSDRIAAAGYLVKALSRSPKALANRAFYGTIKRLFI